MTAYEVVRRKIIADLKEEGWQIVKLEPITLPRGFEVENSYAIREVLI